MFIDFINDFFYRITGPYVRGASTQNQWINVIQFYQLIFTRDKLNQQRINNKLFPLRTKYKMNVLARQHCTP